VKPIVVSETNRGSIGEPLRCPDCGGGPIETEIHPQRFKYGEGDKGVELVASVPFHHCSNCGFEYLDDKAEEARHEAVCRHLGMLTPREIVGLRESCRLSRSEFSRLTRLGEATVARWERGALIQNAANDFYLRLLFYRENVHRLQQLTQTSEVQPPKQSVQSIATRFKSLGNPEGVRAHQVVFQLRKVG
jgi:putative zinc finger/helix-turn-helix YgiT family protein